MADSMQEAKKTLRQQVRERIAAISDRNAASDLARNQLLQKAVWRQARSILLFAPLPGEVDVWPLLPEVLRQGKSLALPRFIAAKKHYAACQIKDLVTDVKIGQFGNREAADHCAVLAISRLDLILVPGIAFDLHGRRLGRGKGFYDQLLAEASGTTCGVAFDEQIVKEIPVEPHDIFLDCILTPTRWIEP